MGRISLAIVIISALLAPLDALAQTRVWTDASGRQMRARFKRLEGENVVLIKDFRPVTVPLSKFSEADQAYIKQLHERSLVAARELDASDQGDSEMPDSDAPAESSSVNELPPLEREWVDKNGNRIEAKFVRIHEFNVVLIAGARVRSHDFTQFSDDDQQFLIQWLREHGQEATAQGLEQHAEAQKREQSLARSTSGPSTPPIGDSSEPNPGMPGAVDSLDMTAQSQRIQQEAMRRIQEQMEERRRESERQLAEARRRESERQLADERRRQDRERERAREENSSQLASLPSTPSLGRQPFSHRQHSSFPFSQDTVSYCSNCSRQVPAHVGAGDHCPHCGVYFEYEETAAGGQLHASGKNSSDSSNRTFRIRLRGVISLIILIGGCFAALFRKLAS